MARIRTIKPEFFRHEELFQAEIESKLPLRVAFIGLWTVCDREGRFRWHPRVLKLDILPFDDVDFTDVLASLAKHGFITRYDVGDQTFGHIPTWQKHQWCNERESQSTIPEPPEACACTVQDSCMHSTRLVQTQAETRGERERKGKGKGGNKEGKGCKGRETIVSSPDGDAPALIASATEKSNEEKFLDFWNQLGICQATTIGPKRRKQLHSRLAEPGWLDAANKALARIHEKRSSFLNGSKGWKANIDWFLKADTVSKINEGQYDT